MREPTSRGYLYVPAPGEGKAVLAYARSHPSGLALPVGVSAENRRDPRSAVVAAAAAGALPGLYKAKVHRPMPDAQGAFKVERGARVKALVADEIRRLTAIAHRPDTKHLTERDMKEARMARALTDALRTHVLSHRPPVPRRRKAVEEEA